MKKIQYSLNDFKEKQINKSKSTFTANDLFNYHKNNSLFQKNPDGKYDQVVIDKFGILKPVILFTIISYARTNIKRNKNIFYLSYDQIRSDLIKLGFSGVSDQYLSELIQLLKQNDYIERIQRGNRWFIVIKAKLKNIYDPSTNKQLLFNLNPAYNQLIRFFTNVCKVFSSKLNSAVDIIKKILLGIPVYKNSSDFYYSNYSNCNEEHQYSSKKNKNLPSQINTNNKIAEILTDEDIEEMF